MAALLPMGVGVISQLLGGLFGKKQQPQQTQQTNHSTNSSNSIFDNSYSNWSNNLFNNTSLTRNQQHNQFKSNPFITGEYKGMGDLLRQGMMRRLQSGSALPAGFEAQQLQKINSGFDAAKVAAENRMAETGQTGGPASAAVAEQGELARAAAGNDLRTQIPMLERQLSNEDMNMASLLMDRFGKGQEGTSDTTGVSQTDASGQSRTVGGGTSSGTSSTTGTNDSVGTGVGPQPQSGNIFDLLGGLGPLLMMMMGKGNFGGTGMGAGPGEVAGPPGQLISRG